MPLLCPMSSYISTIATGTSMTPKPLIQLLYIMYLFLEIPFVDTLWLHPSSPSFDHTLNPILHHSKSPLDPHREWYHSPDELHHLHNWIELNKINLFSRYNEKRMIIITYWLQQFFDTSLRHYLNVQLQKSKNHKDNHTGQTLLHHSLEWCTKSVLIQLQSNGLYRLQFL